MSVFPSGETKEPVVIQKTYTAVPRFPSSAIEGSIEASNSPMKEMDAAMIGLALVPFEGRYVLSCHVPSNALFGVGWAVQAAQFCPSCQLLGGSYTNWLLFVGSPKVSSTVTFTSWQVAG